MSLVSELPVTLHNLTTDTLRDYFVNTWQLTELLFSSIPNTAELYRQPDPLRLPLIFYLGHPAAFYVNKLCAAGLLKHQLNCSFDMLFAQGVDPDTPLDLRQIAEWPPEEAVRCYRDIVFRSVLDAISEITSCAGVEDADPLWAILMSIEHERIHFETSSVLIRQCPHHLLVTPRGWDYAPLGTNRSGKRYVMVDVPPGKVQIGKQITVPTFGWDNEYGELHVDVSAFQASNSLITNEEFSEFVLDGGYGRDDLWSLEGNEWKHEVNATRPRFWRNNGGDGFLYRAMFAILPFPSEWPVEVNYHEACAFCKWKGGGIRLLKEKEYMAIMDFPGTGARNVRDVDQFNLNLKYGSPCPAGLHCSSHQRGHFNDVRGNVWTWLSDHFYPLPGFNQHRLYPDFSSPFFGNKHRMMRGGSWASTGTSASQYYRLWFRPQFYQHAGFRVAADVEP
jgi:5-histidylcysteine sulfoxide synthase